MMNYEENRIHREFVDDVDSHVAMTFKKAKRSRRPQVERTA